MAQEKETPFKAYEFTDAEEPIAMVFSELQTKHIQTEMASAAARKLLLVHDPQFPDNFIREHEYFRGMIEAFTILLNTSDNKRNALFEVLKAQTENQENNQ